MRLTKKLEPPYEIVLGEDYIYTSETRLTKSFAQVEQKLGQLEDVMDKYNIDTVHELDDEIRINRDKVYKYESIEKELGIDLNTLHKLFKAEYVYAYSHTEIIKCSNDCISLYDKTIAIYNGVCVVEYPLSEYGKSFALTKEELL